MLIDWFTVLAQVINFVILVWLLKRFLYKPVLAAIAAREKSVVDQINDAENKKAEAQKERDEFQRKNEEFDGQRAALLSKATDDAKAERQRLFDEARQAADTLNAKRQESLRNDAHNLNQAISRRTQQEVFAIARKTLTDLATTSLEARMVEVFIRRLREMDAKTKEILAEAIKTASDPVLVRSAFDLPEEGRAAIQNALNEIFSAKVKIKFETTPDQISGIELTTNGQKVAWSIADYLASLEKGVSELLKEKGKSEVQAQNPSALTQQIGKRAYELYEEHGHKEGMATQDWETAEREIRNKITEPVLAKPKPASKVETKPEVKPATKGETKTEVEPLTKVGTKPEVNPEAKVEAKAEVKLAAGAKTKTEVKSDAKSEPAPEVKAISESNVEPKTSAKVEPEKPVPETKSP